jgi:glutaredoxin
MKHAKVKKVKKLPKQNMKNKPVVDDNKPKSRIMSCIVTGLERRVSKLGVLKGIKKFGDLPTFIENYVSNEAKRLLRQRVSPEEVQKQLRPDNKKPFSIDHQVLARLKLLKKQRFKKITLEEVKQISIKWIPKEPKTYSSLEAYIIDNTQNGSCIAPQLFLDSDRVCDHCKYTKHCLSTAKVFSKKYKAAQ